ncbi:palmitoyl[protein] hydrolase [Synchytrium endobioticum]|uniref:Palmitoyl-protein thioesterase 1 n=1 Tax=Synchytrium endobioticum TaxID=286115 RepID=A0A507D7J3_9FUNG|nr:palmitoyl[protein] hydrolase [Synchytrium endobioticum]TPX47559.1 palmitoyl[protein] hydrolase [Synchytrium endobioticum]
MKLNSLIVLALALGSAAAKRRRSYRPVVLYHGLGDTANGQGMTTIKETIENELPGIYVKNIQIGENDREDRDFTFIDNANRQVDEVCEKLAEDKELVDGFNAIGFSQGGLFLRAYIERCNDPPVYNIITFGTPHNGIGDVPSCGEKSVFTCQVARNLLERGAYLSFVQQRVVQAQYYKDMTNYLTYLQASIFLADINNERDDKKRTYADNLTTLNKLIMVKFRNDTTLVPRESAWFGYYNEDLSKVLHMRELPIYKEDWIGLQKLDKLRKVVFVESEGDHMQFTLDFFVEAVVKPYLSEPLLAPTVRNMETPLLGLVNQG